MDNSSDEVLTLIERVESSPDKYKHLQVFLSRKANNEIRIDNEFLMVTPRAFGKVIIRDLTVEGNYINIELYDCTKQEHGNIRIIIDDDKPQTFFISWQDVKRMVLDETLTLDKDGLLEFDFSEK